MEKSVLNAGNLTRFTVLNVVQNILVTDVSDAFLMNRKIFVKFADTVWIAHLNVISTAPFARSAWEAKSVIFAEYAKIVLLNLATTALTAENVTLIFAKTVERIAWIAAKKTDGFARSV